MNITRENFEDNFEVMREAIRASHFIAVDAEFTGLRLPDAPREKATDSLKVRYELARSSCSCFMLTQYGVCCFRFDDEGHLEARPFNAFVLPSSKFGTDRVYSCQSSSMAFLSKHGFDFNAWIAHGVPFLSRAEEAAIEAKLRARWVRDAAAAVAAVAEKEKQAAAAAEIAAAEAQGKGEPAPAKQPAVHTARDGTTLESLSEADQAMILDARTKVENLVKAATNGSEYTESSLKFEPMDARKRWLMFEFVGSNNGTIKLCNLSGPYSARGIEARTVCQDPKLQAIAEAKLRAEAEAKQLEDLRKAVGFRRVVDEISKAGKPVITHNGLLDLVHTHDKFVGPVPADLDEGTKALHALFPVLIDNKVVMTSATRNGLKFPKTTLGEGYQWLQETFPKSKQVVAAMAAAAEPGAAANGQAMAAPADPGAAENGQAVAAPADHPRPASGADGDKSAPPGGGDGLEVAVGGDGENGKAEVEEAAAAAAGVKRRVWDATFAPGFEERYAAGGQEHEAGFDAYLTGCCFAAAATLGLGVGVRELREMASGGGVPEALAPVSNVIPLFKMFGGQSVCLPGPAPAPDLSCYVHVSGFPSTARTDAIMRPLKAVDGCENVWFHWIDDTSGVAECPSAEEAKSLREAAASAAAAASGSGGDDGAGPAAMAADTASVGESERAPRVVDPKMLELEDMTFVPLNSALLYGDSGQEGKKEGVEEGRGAKRHLEEGDKVEEQAAKKTAGGGDAMVL